MIEMILEHGAHVNATTKGTMRTALHVAAFIGNEDIILLLLKYHASTEEMDIKGDMPLQVAMRFDNKHTAGILGPLVRQPAERRLSKKDKSKGIRRMSVRLQDRTRQKRQSTDSSHRDKPKNESNENSEN